MPRLLCYLLIVLHFQVFSQLQYGFDKEEALDMIALCNSFSFIELYNSDSMIIPKGYEKIYTSGVLGMENKYQVYKKGKIAVICFRGSIRRKLSWLENINSAMVPAQGLIEIEGSTFNFKFASDTAAAVHCGYALAMAYMSNDLLSQINNLNNQGIFNIIITGHSQGGALANMLRAYLENLTHSEISKHNQFKTYAFAAPMIGNIDFVAEYNVRYCKNNSSFNIINPQDPIPNMPFSYDEGNYMKEVVSRFLFDPDSVSPRKFMADLFFNTFKGTMNRNLDRMSTKISEQVAKELGTVKLPAFDQDMNYFKVGNLIEIEPAVYPEIIIDISPVEEDMQNPTQEKQPYKKTIYRKEPGNFQHLPYNYYVSVLKTFFPSAYLRLDKKYLPETL